MYPLINVFWYPIYTFWIFLVASFLLFIFMLKKLSFKYNYDFSIFSNNFLWYILSIFFFSRLFYVIFQFSDLKYFDKLSDFFATVDYNFSLFGAMFWFFLVFFILLRLRREKAIKYIDWIVLSFLMVLVVWYFWALLWGQVYWKITNYWIEITYTNPFSPIASTPVFPLPVVYSILFFIEFASLYILSMYIKVKWFIWYIWLVIFSLIIIIFENFSGRYDMLSTIFFINFNQLLAFFLLIFSFYRLYVISKISAKDTTIVINHK